MLPKGHCIEQQNILKKGGVLKGDSFLDVFSGKSTKSMIKERSIS